MSPTNRVKLSTALTAIAAVANTQDTVPVSQLYLAFLPEIQAHASPAFKHEVCGENAFANINAYYTK